LPDNITLGGCLYLNRKKITSLPDNLTVGGGLYLSWTKITSLPDNLTVGGYLDLRGTGITSLPDNLTVGGYLDLSGIPITSLPDNLTVGNDLDLRGTGITSLPDNLTVGGDLYLSGTGITSEPKYTKLRNGDYKPGKYIYADGILTHIKSEKSIGKYTYYVGKIKGRNVITDGTNYAHCGSVREGIEDLEFKAAKDRGAEQYRGLSLDSEVSAADIITMYRVITGACRQGTQAFIESIGKLKDRYTVAEAIEITNGQYGSERFKKFFEEEK